MKLACKEYQNACFRTPAQKTKGYSKTAANIDAGKAKYNMSGKSSKNESCHEWAVGAAEFAYAGDAKANSNITTNRILLGCHMRASPEE
jgi:hypothetical protein